MTLTNRRDMLKLGAGALVGALGLASVRNIAYAESAPQIFGESCENHMLSPCIEDQGVLWKSLTVEELQTFENNLRLRRFKDTKLHFTDDEGFSFSRHRVNYTKTPDSVRMWVANPDDSRDFITEKIPLTIYTQEEYDEWADTQFENWINASYFATTHPVYFPETSLGDGYWKWNSVPETESSARLWAFRDLNYAELWHFQKTYKTT